MPFLEAVKNFAYSTVLTAPSPASSGTSLVLQSGDGAKFPTAPFWIVVWATSANPLTTNAEVCLVTAVSTDTLTIVRAQDGSSARTVVVGDQVMLGITAELLRRIARMPAGYMVCETDFMTTASWTTNIGSGGSTGWQSLAGHPGQVTLLSGTTASSQTALMLTGQGSTSMVSFSDHWETEWIVQLPAVVSDTDVRVGVMVQNNAAPNWGIWFEKLAADTNWFVEVAMNGTFDTRQDTTVVATASGWFRLSLRYDGSKVYYAVNGGAETAYTPTNYPTGTTLGYALASIRTNTTASSRTLALDYARYSVLDLTR